jgi:hypothetical protein
MSEETRIQSSLSEDGVKDYLDQVLNEIKVFNHEREEKEQGFQKDLLLLG